MARDKDQNKRKATSVDKYVGSRVRERRLLLSMAQTDLAERMGVRFQMVQKYEHGLCRLSASRLWDVAGILGVEVGWFFEGLAGKGLAGRGGER